MSEQLIPTPGVFGENGNFLLERELGAGGMGGVYMGRDKMLDRPVAVKVMMKEYGNDPEFVEKFKKEAQAAAKLIHPNIAQIYSYGICDGMPYIAMELVAGGSLYSIMQNSPGTTDIPRVLKICQQVAQALQCASDQGFVHGDVKPENVLLDANGNAKLVDFGLAAMQKDTDEIWGTPYYISPEKVRKEPIDYRADMYSLGGTLYHALTGVAPFEGEDSIAVVKKRFDGPPKKPSEIRPEITPAIDGLVMKMLALDKNERYPSFEALLEAFKEVLTSGLTANAAANPTVAAKKPMTGRPTARMTTTLRTGRRTIAMRRKPTTVSPETAAEPGEAKPEDSEDDEEGGGNLGAKIALFVVGGILLIGAIVGGLIWFKVSSAAAEQAEIQAQISSSFSKAKEAIADTVKNATNFANEFDAFAKRATDECEKTTAALAKILPEEHAKMLKPGPTQELLDAIAATNAPVQAEAPAAAATNAPAPAAAAPAATNAAPAAVAATTNAPAAKPAAAATNKTETAKAAAAPKEPEKKQEEQVPQVVLSMHELWARAYSCQAGVIRIRQAERKILEKAAQADEIKEVTRENTEKLAAMSRDLVDLVDMMKTSKDVENVKKGIAFIKSKGESTVQQTVKRLRIEKLEAERKAKAEAAAAAEKARKEKAEADRKELIEKETAEVKTKFETIAAQGSFRLLDWQTAIRQLETLKSDLKTAEAHLAADSEIRKVTNMKKVHDVLVKSMQGYVFRKGGKPNMKGYKVTSVSDKEIQLEKPGGKGKQKCTWSRFYKDFPNNFNEVINTFIVDGRKNAKPHLNLREWAEAMTGAALTMQIVCSEVTGAVEYGEKLVKDAVKQFPEYLKFAKEMFPDVTFETSDDE